MQLSLFKFLSFRVRLYRLYIQSIPEFLLFLLLPAVTVVKGAVLLTSIGCCRPMCTSSTQIDLSSCNVSGGKSRLLYIFRLSCWKACHKFFLLLERILCFDWFYSSSILKRIHWVILNPLRCFTFWLLLI